MTKLRTFSLDEETIAMLDGRAKSLHLSRSAVIRLLIMQKEEGVKVGKQVNEL